MQWSHCFWCFEAFESHAGPEDRKLESQYFFNIVPASEYITIFYLFFVVCTQPDILPFPDTLTDELFTV